MKNVNGSSSMRKYHTFIDEFGTPAVEQDRCYILTAVLTSPESLKKIESEFSQIKKKYFGRKSYYFHRTNLISNLRSREVDIRSFTKDLENALNNHFFVFQVIVDNRSAVKKRWNRQYIYNRAFRILLGNILKFSIAKNLNITIVAEASSDAQDINLYKNFFHHIANGIDRLGISHNDAKQHFTSLNFVTKLNNDCGAQIADLLGKSGAHILRVDRKELTEEAIKNLDLILYRTLKKKLFKSSVTVKDNRKRLLYSEINSFTILT